MPARLDAIEFKLAHLEQAMHELNEVIIRQQRELDQTRQRLGQLGEQLAGMEPGAGGTAAGFEKPPHY